MQNEKSGKAKKARRNPFEDGKEKEKSVFSEKIKAKWLRIQINNSNDKNKGDQYWKQQKVNWLRFAKKIGNHDDIF